MVLRHAPRRRRRARSSARPLGRPVPRALVAAALVPAPLPARLRRVPRGGAVLIDDGEHLADLDVLAFLALDAGEDAALLGADLEVDLLGFELDQRLADLDAVAFLLQPLRDARFDDRFAQFWNDDVGHDAV